MSFSMHIFCDDHNEKWDKNTKKILTKEIFFWIFFQENLKINLVVMIGYLIYESSG